MVQATSEDDVPQCDHRLSPLEVAAKANWNSTAVLMWDELDHGERDRAIFDMGTALLALAACELPAEISRCGRETLLTYGKTTDDVFARILREIAIAPLSQGDRTAVEQSEAVA